MLTILNILLREFVSFVLTLYFRNWVVTGKDNIPGNGPVIFAGNHQNAFLDALLVTCSSGRLPYYLARAEVFKGPLARTLLKLIRIMPIYRFRDGIGSVRKNDEIIKICVDLLSKKHMITMFPEGNHAEEWRVRTLQRGLPRIALQTETESEWKAGLMIVPVGIQYEEPKSFRSRVIVNFGEPVPVSSYRKECEADQRKCLDTIKDDLREKMKPLILHFPEENYQTIKSEFLRRRSYHKNYFDQFLRDKIVLESVISNSETVHHPSDSSKIRNPLSLLFAVWVLINNFIPYLLVKKLLDRVVKDPVFTGSLKFVFGIIIPPLFYLLAGIAISMASGVWWYGLVYMGVQPGLGYFGGFDALIPLFRKKEAT